MGQIAPRIVRLYPTHMFKIHPKRAVAIIFTIIACFAQGQATNNSTPAKHPPTKTVDLSAKDFNGVDPCLRDTTGEENVCARRYGIAKGADRAPERPCYVAEEAVNGLKDAVKLMKKESPDIEVLVISSFRPAEHQQCLWVEKTDNGFKCNPYVCGPRDPKTGARMPCKYYDLSLPQYEKIYDHCPHVNKYTVDLCAYDKKNVRLNSSNQLDMRLSQDCRNYSDKNADLPDGQFYHPCSCRFVSWTEDFRNGSARAKKIFGDEETKAQQIMIRSMRQTGWTDNAPGEWWHFKYLGKKK